MRLESVQDRLAKFAVPIAVLCCVGWSAIITKNYILFGKFSNDFGVLWRVASHPASDAYSTAYHWPFPYIPTMLLWVQPLALLPKWVAFGLFVASSLTAYIAVIRRYVPWSAVALCLIAPSLVRGAYTGQVSMLMAALAICGLAHKDRIITGVVFGIIASIKPQLVVMAPLFFASHREWRAFVSAGVTFILTVSLSLALFGPERWPEWWASLDYFHQVLKSIRGEAIGVTPAIIAEHYGFGFLPFLLLGVTVGALIVVLSPRGDPVRDAAIITISSLMAAPYALSYDLAALMPLLALMTLRGNLLAALSMGTPFQAIPLIVSAAGVAKWPLAPSFRSPSTPSDSPSPSASSR